MNEKIVRQNLISYLIEKLQVPKDLIRVEEPLANYGVKSRKRADIIIERYSPSENAFYTLAVIECKAAEVFLDEAFNQLYDYAAELNCKYCCLTNGEENFCYCFDEDKNYYVKIEKLPTYSEMLQGKYSPAPFEEPPPRIKFEELEEKYQIYVDDGSIGTDTPKRFAVPMVNFLECLLDINHKFPAKHYKIFSVIEDYGIRKLTVGTTSGGTFDEVCRAFVVNYNGIEKFISMSVSNYGNGKTTINIAIDRENDSHHSLECVVDNNFEVIADRIKFFHSGRITKGRGALKIAGLREIVATKYPQIIDGKKFYLGTLTHNRLWYLDDIEVMQVIENLISYALIRDDYREIFSSKK